MRRLGVSCEERADSIRIVPGEVRPAVIQTYEDHRMAMAFSIIGAMAPGIVIDNPLCCRKTFENYFDILTNLDLSLE